MRRLRRLAAIVLIPAGALLAIVSLTPLTLWWTQVYARPWDNDRVPVLIVLGGEVFPDGLPGITSNRRGLYAIRYWREGGVQRIVICGGGSPPVAPAIREMMVNAGVPASIIEIETSSSTTYENLREARRLLSAPGAAGGPAAIVTSDYHAYRAWLVARKLGMDVKSRPAPDYAKSFSSVPLRWYLFWGLTLETAKHAWYRWKGWI